MGANEVSLVPSTAVPSPFVILKTMVGFLPAATFVTLTMVAFSPLSCFDFSGMACAPLMEASNSSALSG